ncbi:von Willebrand factor A domain-containing protein 2-like [Mytilus trossulus]|uniref:von Willebrand factor A domain-containing protein 2-like n=1 Tax=Mytilus trossulus TaxID=6551 RepID=UPI003007C0BF
MGRIIKKMICNRILICIMLCLATKEVISSKVSWNLPASVAKSFLTSRHKRSDPRCDDVEGYCEHNKHICMQHNENSREIRCTSSSCLPTQTCYLATPCPGHWQIGCTDDQCLSFPCSNGGSCHDLTGNYRCNCIPGWDEATSCSTDKNECLTVPCQNGGSCTDKWADFSCHCTKRFNGTTCEKDCRPGHADITFVVDSSSSQETDINRTVEFISKFVNKLPMGPNDYQFSVITYGFTAQVLFDFNDFSSKLDILHALKQIHGIHSPTYTKVALSKAVELAKSTTSGSRLTNASHYIILLYDGLSSDRHDAENYAISLNQHPVYQQPIKSIMTVAVGRSVDHSEMVMLSNKPELTFDLLHFDDIYNKLLKDTAHKDCTDCMRHTDTDIIILQDIKMNQTSEGYRSRQEAIRRVIEKVVRYNADAHIGLYSYTNNISQVFPLFWSNNTDKMVATALQVDRKRSLTSNLSYALNQLRQKGFVSSHGGRSSNRKIIVIVSDGNWRVLANVKREVTLLQQSHIEVVGVVAGHDCSYDNFVSVLFDPSQVYYVAENDFTSLESFAGMTSYYKCDNDIFIKRQ